MLNRQRRSRKTSSRQIREEKELVLPGTDLTFLFQRDGCRTLRMAIRPDGSVRVKAPARLAMEQVFSFMHARLDWIRAKQDFSPPIAVLPPTSVKAEAFFIWEGRSPSASPLRTDVPAPG